MRPCLPVAPVLGTLAALSSLTLAFASDHPTYKLALEGRIDTGVAVSIHTRYVSRNAICRVIFRQGHKQFNVAAQVETAGAYHIESPLNWGQTKFCRYRLESASIHFQVNVASGPAPKELVIPLQPSRTRSNPLQGIDGTSFACAATQGQVQCTSSGARVQLTSLDLPDKLTEDFAIELNVVRPDSRLPDPLSGTGDLGFRYDPVTRRCLKDGQAGRNPGFVGQCGLLSGSDLHEAKLRGSDLSGARLLGVNLAGADLTEADLSSATLYNCNLSQANLTGAKLERAEARKNDLTDANLSNADLRGANLAGSILKRAHLLGANFDLAVAAGADLQGALFHMTDLDGTVLDGATLTGTDLTTSHFSGSPKLHGADLSQADLRGVDLQKADLSSAKLINAQLQSANLEKADLGSADVSGADLTGAQVQDARFGQARYSESTKLPFDESRAKDFGMVLTPPPPAPDSGS
jgi:uncharacterized protein YjbI with pentapeptide repeats